MFRQDAALVEHRQPSGPLLAGLRLFLADRINVADGAAEPAAIAFFAVNDGKKWGLGDSFLVPGLHTGEQLAAAGAAVADEGGFMPYVVGDVGEPEFPRSVEDGEELTCALLLCKSPAGHELSRRPKRNAYPLQGRPFPAGLPEMLLLVATVAYPHGAENGLPDD
jgi:hypothetical protein